MRINQDFLYHAIFWSLLVSDASASLFNVVNENKLR